MMKRVVLMSVLMALLVVGCGNKKADTPNQNDVELVDGVVQHEEEDSIPEKNFEACEEILNAELDSGKIQIGDTIVSFPMKVRDLTEQTNAEYISIGYKPDIMSNDYMVSESDGAVIAGLYFMDAECKAVYYSDGCETEVSPAGDLYTTELREITTKNIFLPKGIKVGMTLSELQEILGERLEVGYAEDEEVIEYQVKFLVDDEETNNRCIDYYETMRDYDYSAGFYGVLSMNINRATGILDEMSFYMGYDARYY